MLKETAPGAPVLPYYTDRINSYTSSFSYDSIGNILNKNQKNVGTYTDGSTKTLTDTTYDWDYKYTSTRPHAVTQTGTLFYTYDASGNMTKKTDTNTNASTVFTWNEENRLTQTVATTTSTTDTATTIFRYDDTGTRIAKKGANGETIYVNTNYSIKDEQLESTHIFAGQTRIATKLTMLTTKTTTTDMGVYYYHPDHIGSASTVTDNNGKFTEHCEYFPYGEVWISESASTSVTSLLPFKFTGKELDPETGLYYYGARYMDPKLGRFISTDAYLDPYIPMGGENPSDLPGMGGAFNPQNLNLYEYTLNNPIRIVDPDGNTSSTGEMYRNDPRGNILSYPEDTSSKGSSTLTGSGSLTSEGKNASAEVKANTTMAEQAKSSGNSPMRNSEETQSYAQHGFAIDLKSINKNVFACDNGKLTYSDGGDGAKSYGFNAKLTFDSGNVMHEKIFGHLERPTNANELIGQPAVNVKAGTAIGVMGNTGDCWTAHGTGVNHPVSGTERAQGWGTHLHYEYRMYQKNSDGSLGNYNTVNPYTHFPGGN